MSPFFAARLRELDEVVQRESGWSLVEKILDDEQNFDTESAQVGITCIQIALTEFLQHLGAKPAAVVGQSMGEIAAAFAVGGLSKEDAVLVACHRSRLMGEGEDSLPEEKQGAMAVVEFGVEELATFTSEHSEFAKVEPAVYAAPGMTTVGEPREPVAKLVEHLEAEGKFARLLPVKGAATLLCWIQFWVSCTLKLAIFKPVRSTPRCTRPWTVAVSTVPARPCTMPITSSVARASPCGSAMLPVNSSMMASALSWRSARTPWRLCR